MAAIFSLNIRNFREAHGFLVKWQLFLVNTSILWWKEAQDSSSSEVKRGIFYAVSSAPPYGGAMIIFNSDFAFNLRKEDDSSFNSGAYGEVKITSQDYALVPVKCSCPHSSGLLMSWRTERHILEGNRECSSFVLLWLYKADGKSPKMHCFAPQFLNQVPVIA
ncbi:Ubiquitin carboxyl-terminal hydrolase [Forsythia ovata]|uniref:Ubiquitin carboxyl-terminal hydrolase n=1 Tax=Forsythia ovata TaxID=205694 RepID=A0ABD1TN81_9LAMI